MSKKIQDPDFWYSFLLPYVNWQTRRSYRRFEVHGKDKLPKDGGLVFGVNHSNTLMDALVLLSSDNIKKVFIARGDIFKKPSVAKILTFLVLWKVLWVVWAAVHLRLTALRNCHRNPETMDATIINP